MPEKSPRPNHLNPLRFNDNSIHIWQADLDALSVQRSDLEAHLDHAERDRAAHLRRPLNRARFITGRGQLRELLAHCLGVSPSELVIAYTSQGKPFLRDYPHYHFNVAHTCNLALWAISYNSKIGIDIEQIRPDPHIPLKTLIPRTLCEREADLLHQREGDPIPLFLQFWTRKEAFLKATGRGLSMPLTEIDTSAPNNQISLCNSLTHQWSNTNWFSRSLTTFPNCIASLVTRDQNPQIVHHKL